MLSIPYAIKSQDANVEEIEPTSPAEKQAILANQNIHHRDETYRGISDFSLRFSHTRHGILRGGDHFIALLGTSIPMGKTEDDPFKLGDAGLKHLHIQFGTGTFNPLAEVHYGTPLFRDFSMSASIRGQFPFYENSKNLSWVYGSNLDRRSKISPVRLAYIPHHISRILPILCSLGR